MLAWPLLSSEGDSGRTGMRSVYLYGSHPYQRCRSVAGNVIDSISEHFSHHHGVRKGAKATESGFDAELAKTQTASTATATAPVDTQSVLMSQLLGSPEVATALASANPSQPVQVEMSAAGNVSLRNGNGDLHALKISDDTRALVSKLYTAHQSSVVPDKNSASAVLAIDPTHATAPAWSSLPARTA